MDRSAPLLLVKLRARPGEEFRLVTDQVLAFKYIDRERKADLCKLTVDNNDLSNFDDPVWSKGATLIVQWGYPGAMAPAREVVITSVKGFKDLQIEATATSILMNLVSKSRVFENRTISQVVRDIATENGFGTDRQFVDDTEETMEIVAQSRLTDAQFLRRWASRVGFEFFVDFDGLHFHERRLGERPVRVLRYHDDPGAGDILGEPQIENDLTAKPGRTRVRGRNPETKEDIDETADNETDNERRTLTEFVEVIDPDSGKATLVERPLASEETVTTSDATTESARRRARGRFRRAQQVAVKMSLSIVGDPLLLAKSVVKIEGMGRRLSVRYYVEEVEHDLGTAGYECKLKLVSDGHGGHSTTSSRAVGLSALAVAQRGPGSNDRDRQVLQQLRDTLSAAEAQGDTQRAQTIQRAIDRYQRGGNRARAEVTRAMNSISQDPNADTSVRQASATVANSLAQRGGETASGGRPNRQEPQEEVGEVLEPVQSVDPETGKLVTRYRQAPPRGTRSEE